MTLTDPAESQVDSIRHIFEAAIHQSRQPLFVLHNSLAAASILAERLPASSEAKLMHQAIAQLQASVSKLSRSLSRIEELITPPEGQREECDAGVFLMEIVQIVGFVLRTHGISLRYEPRFAAEATVSALLARTQIRAVKWMLKTSSDLIRTTNSKAELSIATSIVGEDILISMKNESNGTERALKFSDFDFFDDTDSYCRLGLKVNPIVAHALDGLI